MKSVELGRFLTATGNQVFGNEANIRAVRQRLCEEKLLPVYNNSVSPIEAARMIIYCFVLPYVSKTLANGFIQQYEQQFKTDAQGNECDLSKTSIGYLSRLLSGSQAIPSLIRIDSKYGSISVDKKIGSQIITDAEFWRGRFDKVPQSDGSPESYAYIPGEWLEMLRDKIKAGLDV